MTLPGEFEVLFDFYRINFIVVTLYPTYNVDQMEGTAVTTTNIPRITWFVDHDDSLPPATLTEVYQRGKYRERLFDRSITIKLRPSCLLQIESPTIGATPKFRQWVDAANTSVRHFGLKWAIHGLAPNQNFFYNYHVKYYLSFKVTR